MEHMKETITGPNPPREARICPFAALPPTATNNK
jgi:hypothetical protein